MINHLEFELSRTGGDHWVFSAVVDDKHGVIHFFPGMPLENFLSEIKKTFPGSKARSGEVLRSAIEEAYDLGKRTEYTMFEMQQRGISYRALKEHGSLWDQPKDVVTVKRFNAKWRVSCFRNALRSIRIPRGLTYEEALSAFQEVMVVEPVMDS